MIRKNPVRVKLVKTPLTKRHSKVVVELSPAKARVLKRLSYYNVTIPAALVKQIGRGTAVDEIKDLLTDLSHRFMGVYP